MAHYLNGACRSLSPLWLPPAIAHAARTPGHPSQSQPAIAPSNQVADPLKEALSLPFSSQQNDRPIARSAASSISAAAHRPSQDARIRLRNSVVASSRVIGYRATKRVLSGQMKGLALPTVEAARFRMPGSCFAEDSLYRGGWRA